MAMFWVGSYVALARFIRAIVKSVNKEFYVSCAGGGGLFKTSYHIYAPNGYCVLSIVAYGLLF